MKKDRKDKGDGYDWIEFLAGAGKLVGLNPVRTRWKLRAWQDRVKGKGRSVGDKAALVTRENKVCHKCGSINGIDAKVCYNCKAKLRSRYAEVLERFLRHFSLGLTPETFLAAAYMLVFAITVFKGPDSGWMGAGVYDLFHLGGNYGPATLAGEWWRIWTCVFIHGGLVHLGFNTYALIYVMPTVRDIYGPNKAMFVFLAGGIGSSIASMGWEMFTALAGHASVSVGASGALCALIGFLLVWGHRDGTSLGLQIRNSMGRWVMYTLVFGFIANSTGAIGVDNAAHVSGWIIGGIMALAIPTNLTRAEHRAWKVLGAIAYVAVLAAAAYVTYRGLALPFPNPPA